MLELPLVQRPLGRSDGSSGDRPHGTEHPRLVQTQDDTHRRTPVAGCGLGGRDPFDPLLTGTERGRDDEDASGGPVGERGAELGGSGARSGQHGDLVVRTARVDGRPRIAAVRADDDRVVPGQPEPGEGRGDGGDTGAYVEGVAGEPFRQGPDDPEEPGVPRGQHDDRLALPDVGLDGVERGRERAEDDLLGVLGDGDGGEMAPPADDEPGTGEHVVHRGRPGPRPGDRDHVLAPRERRALRASGSALR